MGHNSADHGRFTIAHTVMAYGHYLNQGKVKLQNYLIKQRENVASSEMLKDTRLLDYKWAW